METRKNTRELIDETVLWQAFNLALDGCCLPVMRQIRESLAKPILFTLKDMGLD